jgi:AcrR family transcriptional regulator
MGKRSYAAGESAKREICSALKTLMAQKPLDKITVAELMRTCGMTRQHFYYHFEDIYAAVRWMFDEEAMALLRRHEGVMLWQDGLLQLFRYLQENRAVCLCAMNSISREHLKRFFQNDINAIIGNTVRGFAGQFRGPADERELELLTKFYVGALTGIVEDWLLGEIRESPEELIQFTDRFLRDYMVGAKLRLAGGGQDMILAEVETT